MRYISFALLFGIGISMAACSKNSSSTNTPLPTVAVTAKINGTPWTANLVWSSKQTSSPAETVITGEDTTTAKSVTLYLFSYNNTTGPFNADGTEARCAWISSYSSTGSILITSTDGGYIKGNFGFTAADGTVVTDGVFVAQLP